MHDFLCFLDFVLCNFRGLFRWMLEQEAAFVPQFLIGLQNHVLPIFPNQVLGFREVLVHLMQ